MKRIILLLCVVSFVGNAHVFAQGLISGFMQGAGKSVVALTEFSERYDKYYVGQQQTNNTQLGEIHTYGLSFYAATGITSWADVIVNVPYIIASSNAGFWATQSNFQDFSAALRIRPLSLTFDVGRLDVIIAGVGSLPISSYQNDAPVAIGHQARGVDGRALVQYTANSGVFVTAQWGYMARGKVEVNRGFQVDVPDAIDVSTKAGWSNAEWYADVWVNTLIAQSGTNIGPGVAFPSNAQSYTRIGGTLAYNIGWGFTIVGSGMATVNGRNVGHTLRSSAGIVYQLPQL